MQVKRGTAAEGVHLRAVRAQREEGGSMRRFGGLSSRRIRWASAAFVAITCALALTAPGALADAGNPITGTIKASSTDNGNSLTVYVRGQWNWLSHGSDCNVDRAATGVGVIWNDLNGTGTTRGANEIQRIALSGTVTNATFKLTFKNPSGTNATSAVINAADTAAQLQAKLEAMASIGAGNVSVTGSPGAPWNIEFTGSLAKTNVNALAAANKSGGLTVTITTPTSGVAPVYNGYLVANGGISAYVGTKTANGLNPQDQMVHPVDRGNQVEGYRTSGTDYPANQTFFDPPSNSVTSTSTWRGGCGRIPIGAIASKGNPFGEATGRDCATTPASPVCSNEPWGSWGYEKCATVATPGGPCTATPAGAATSYGYTHTYNKQIPDPDHPGQMISGLPDRICVNFYDVHTQTQGSYIPKSGDITVDGNGDNSIDTNAFNPNTTAEGGNCIVFASSGITTQATDGAVGSAGGIWDDATLDIPANAGGTITFKAYGPRSVSSTTPSCTGNPAYTSTISVSGPGHYLSKNGNGGVFNPPAGGKYDWTADYSGDAGVPFVIAVSSPCGAANETSTVSSTPALTLVKSATPATYSAVGQTISYSYLVTNSGGTAFAGPVTVTDDKATVTCPAGGLAIGASMTCHATYTITQADLDAGSVTNTAQAHANGTDSNTDQKTVTAVQSPALHLDKTATPQTYSAVGDTISYSYKLTNTGNVTLVAPFTVSDDKLTVTCPATPTSLAPTASITCTASYTIKQSDMDAGSITNHATGHAVFAGNAVNSNQDTQTVTTTQSPSLHLDKTASPATYVKGTVISYEYKLTNNGNVTLVAPFTVSDDKLSVTCPATPTSLAPGAFITCTASHTATAGGRRGGLDHEPCDGSRVFGGNPVDSNQDMQTVTANQSPSLHLDKTAAPNTYSHVGDVISYSYKLTNNGNVTLVAPFTVTDDKLTVSCPPTPTSLAPTESITCTASYTIQQSDLDNGSITNHATGHAVFAGNAVDSNQDMQTVTATQSPSLHLDKTATPKTYSAVGDVISYSYKLTNNGNVTLVAPFTITDDKLSASCPATPTSLAPTASITCTASYTIQQSDLDNGSITNHATGHGVFNGNAVNSNPDMQTVTAKQSPSLHLDKTATPKTYSRSVT